MLSLAREAKGYTQKELAARLNNSQSRLSKLESGEVTPHEQEIQNLVAVLAQGRDFFFQEAAATSASVSFYRKTRTLPLTMLRRCNAEMNICRLEIERQVAGFKLGNRNLPYLPPQENGGAVSVAQKLRDSWGLAKGPIKNLTTLIEDAGCIIVEYPFPSRKLDGLSIHAEGKPPIIFLNKELPKSRRRLSLAHELGHLIMHTNPHENVEEEAWDFAAEFLTPGAEISDQLANLNIDRLGRLKTEWGISMQAILQRAKKLGKISDSYHRFLWIQIAKCGYRVREPFEDVIPDETPLELEKRLKTKT